MIDIKGVSKRYGDVLALNDITLNIKKGTLFGLIGPDGAGKTTLFRIITTLLKPETGKVLVFGNDSVSDYRTIRRFTGYMPGRFSLYPDLTVEENLTFYATIFGTSVDENYSLIAPIFSFLEPFRNRLSQNLSGGMKQKLALCCALIHNPELLVLDEPTTGVDAVSRKEFWEILHNLKNSGMTILVSTPYMDEAEKCDVVSLMQEGRIMKVDTPGNILEAYKSTLFEIRSEDRLKTISILRSMKEIKRAYLFGQSIHISTNTELRNSDWLHDRLFAEGVKGIEISNVLPDFEDCFIDAVELNKQQK